MSYHLLNLSNVSSTIGITLLVGACICAYVPIGSDF
jgi:hypothetical protein